MYGFTYLFIQISSPWWVGLPGFCSGNIFLFSTASVTSSKPVWSFTWLFLSKSLCSRPAKSFLCLLQVCKCYTLTNKTVFFNVVSLYSRSPHRLGQRPVPVWGLLGTGLHSWRWMTGEWTKPKPPQVQGNFFPWNQSLEPKRLGTIALQSIKIPS